jgi:hypothetical protein
MMSESVTVTVQDGNRPGATANKPAEPSQTNVFAGLRFNPLYFRSIPGIIKIVQLILGIICMACGSPGWSSGHWFLLVAVTAFIITLIWVILYLFSIREVLKLPINWILTELLNTGIYTALYFTAFVAELAWAFTAKYIVAGIFGLFNTLAYAAGTYFLYVEYKSNQQ